MEKVFGGTIPPGIFTCGFTDVEISLGHSVTAALLTLTQTVLVQIQMPLPVFPGAAGLSVNIPMTTTVLITGGFDPVHHGHIGYIRAARMLGDRLVVGINSDAWLARKKGRAFMPWQDRAAVISEMRSVDEVLDFDDSDGSACRAIESVLTRYPDDLVIFANGGDRTSVNIPEQRIQDPRLAFHFGVGGSDKLNSSSWILEQWRAPRTTRPWGYYQVLHQPDAEICVKELTVDPGQSLSMQRHSSRSEFWMVAQGRARVYTLGVDQREQLLSELDQHHHCWIDRLQWHRLTNPGTEPLRIIEIQYGTDCRESDIQRY
jgi:cytidyltransferase-like protein